MDNTAKEINSLYNKDGYYEKYGISLLVSILIILIFFVGWAYFKIMTDIKPWMSHEKYSACSIRV